MFQQPSGSLDSQDEFLKVNFKVKSVTIFKNVGSSFSYETGISGSRLCVLYPPPSVSAPFYREFKAMVTQRKVKTDVEVPEDRTGNLLLRKPCTNQLSYACSTNCHLVR